MYRIGASLSGFELQLLNRVREANAAAQINTLRLATNKKINFPRDNPSGYIQLANWETQQTVVAAARANVTAASALVSQTQLVLDQIRTQLSTIRTKALADVDQALTADERTANQAAIDSAIAEISELTATEVNGRRILDGSASYVVSGVDNLQISDIEVINLGDYPSQTITGEVTVAATQAELTFATGAGNATDDATFTLTGDRGSVAISVTDGESIGTVAERINQESYLTGVVAETDGNDLVLSSVAYGSRADIEVDVTSGTFVVTGGNGDGTAQGINATAVIENQTYTGDGNQVSVFSNGLQYAIEFADGFSGTFDPITVSGEALSFSLTTDVRHKANLAIPGLQPSRLGGPSGRLSDLLSGGTLGGLGNNAPYAVGIVDEALSRLTAIEARVDGFADATISSSSALLSGFNTNLTAAINSVNEVDDEEEQSLLLKNEALAGNAIAALAILDRQRADIVKLIQSIAGLA